MVVKPHFGVVLDHDGVSGNEGVVCGMVVFAGDFGHSRVAMGGILVGWVVLWEDVEWEENAGADHFGHVVEAMHEAKWSLEGMLGWKCYRHGCRGYGHVPLMLDVQGGQVLV